MSRGLDHIAHAVRDLDQAGRLYERLGFTVGARNRHPWGTHNRLVQFPGFFIEFVTFAEPDKLGSDGFSVLFAARNRDFATAHDGLSMLILESQDAAADAQEFQRAGIAASPVMHFEREGRRPDGSPVKVGFSLAFAQDTHAPDIGLATCQQHYPENFWNPAYQRHPNRVRGVASVTLVAAEPQQHRSMLLAFTGAPDARSEGDGYTIPLSRGSISVMTARGFAQRFGVTGPDPGAGARLAAIGFDVADLSAAEARVKDAGIAPRHSKAGLVVPPDAALGATLLFSPAG